MHEKTESLLGMREDLAVEEKNEPGSRKKTYIYVDSARIAKDSDSEDEELDSDLKRWMRDVAGEVKYFTSHLFCMNQYMVRGRKAVKKGSVTQARLNMKCNTFSWYQSA